MTWPWRKPNNFDGGTMATASGNNEAVGTLNPSRDNAFTYEAHRRDHDGGDQGVEVEVSNSDVPHTTDRSASGVDMPDNFYEGEDEDDDGHVEVVLGAHRMRGHVAAMFHSSQKSTKALIGLSLFIFAIFFFAGIGGIVSHNKEVAAMNFAVTASEVEECPEPSTKSSKSSSSPASSTKSSKASSEKFSRRLELLRGMNREIEVKQVPMNLMRDTNKRNLAQRALAGKSTKGPHSSKGSKGPHNSKASKCKSSKGSTAAPTQGPSGPEAAPTAAPSSSPTKAPSTKPPASTAAPSIPTSSPSKAPSAAPTSSPTSSPSKAPSAAPTAAPSSSPTMFPTSSPLKGCVPEPDTSGNCIPTGQRCGDITASENDCREDPNRCCSCNSQNCGSLNGRYCCAAGNCGGGDCPATASPPQAALTECKV